MCVESQGFGKFSSICVLHKITSKQGYVKIFNSLHNCTGTLTLLIMEKIKLVSDLNQNHSRPVLFERDFIKLSNNCSCKVTFVISLTEIYKFSFLNCKSAHS